MRKTLLSLAGIAALFALGCGSNSDEVELHGTGASFPAPLYVKWFTDYKAANPNATIDYQSTGSGQGVTSIVDGTVDFGASDAAMTKEEIAKVSRGVVLLPMTAGEIVLTYNLEGVDELKLSREAYVGIFLGKITKWDDPAIAKHNPNAQLPSKPINVVVRADSSGTSYVFSKHLSEINAEFKKSPGTNKMPNWPVGTKASGNEGVTASLKTTPGSIGYVEYGYAKNTKMPMALLENKAGAFVAPSTASGQAALASVTLPDDLVAWVSDPTGKESYPIVTYTWLLCYKKYDDPKKAAALKEVIKYCLDQGQKSSEELGYIPLPAPVVQKVRAAADQIQGASK
jgi:phosphate transport system substrate-binding protein